MMRRWFVALLFAVCATMLLTSCGEVVAPSEAAKSELTETPAPEVSPQSEIDKSGDDLVETHDYYENEIQGYETYKKDLLKKTALDTSGADIAAIVTKQVEKGELYPDNEATVIIYDVKIRDSSYPYHIPVLVIDNNGKLIYEVLSAGYSSTFYLCDVDGDECEEIVIQCCVANSGGAGGYDSAIYKLKDDNLSFIFRYYYDNSTTGFYLELNDGYKHTISNKYTSFKTTFVRNQLETPYFDEEGNITDYAKEYNDSAGALGDTFYLFEPKDVDSDSIYEIITAQYCSLYGHADGMGTLYTVLKYDINLQKMIVAKAGFWQYRDVSESGNEAYYDEWELYENNWYNQ